MRWTTKRANKRPIKVGFWRLMRDSGAYRRTPKLVYGGFLSPGYYTESAARKQAMMMKTDQRGNLISYGSQQAVDAFDHACNLLHACQADPLAAVDQIIAEHADFAMAHAFRAGMLATATDKAFAPH